MSISIWDAMSPQNLPTNPTQNPTVSQILPILHFLADSRESKLR